MPEREIELLLLASESGDGQFRRFMDAELAAQLAGAGIRCRGCFLNRLTPELLKASDAVLLMRTPMPGHARDDTAAWDAAIPELLAHVEAGGGLMIMFSETYGRSEGTLNQFTRRLGLELCFNRLVEDDPERRGLVPNLDQGRTILADVVPGVIPGLTAPQLELVIEGGHGTQHLTCLGSSDWQPLLRAAPSCVSRPFPDGCYSHGSAGAITAPVLGMARQFGRGRIVAFPGSAPLWIASAGLPRFKGYLLRQHDQAGRRFLEAVLGWVGGNRAGNAPDALAGLGLAATAAKNFSFSYADAAAQAAMRHSRRQRWWIGTVPAGVSRSELIADALRAGFDGMVVVEDYFSLTPEIWRERQREYAGISGITVVPGYEQLDEEGNASVVFNVAELPDQRLRYPNSNLLEDLLVKLSGYTAVCALPSANRYPLWRQGGYNFIELDGPGAPALYRDRVGSAYSVGVFAIQRGVMPGESRVWNEILVPAGMDWKHAVSENNHYSCVTSGVRLETFGLFGPKLMLDDWEGCWYEWDEGEKASLEFALEADSPLAEVTLWDGNEVFRRYTPDSKRCAVREILVLDRDLHLTLSARAQDGSELIAAFPAHTRNRTFWGHVGCDQMNDYHNVFRESPDGFLGIGDRFYEPYGFVTCGFGWGDYIRITSPVPWSDLMPSGIEVSSMTANFKSFHPSPFVVTEDGSGDFLNHHRRTLGRCTAREHLLHSCAEGALLETPGATWAGSGGRVFIPTRAITTSSLWACEAVYAIPKWEPYKPTRVVISALIRWKRDFTLSDGEAIVFGHSLHLWKPGLRIAAGETCLPLDDILGMGSRNPNAFKEWDNMDACRLLRTSASWIPVPAGAEVRLTGDESGEFSLAFHLLPGRAGVRARRWGEDGFLLSCEVLPAERRFAAGSETRLEYTVALGALNPEG